MAPHSCVQWDRILSLELTEKQMAKDIALILTKLEAMDKKMDARDKAMEEKLEKDFAKKWVEKVWIFVLTIAWGAIITSFMYLILNKNN